MIGLGTDVLTWTASAWPSSEIPMIELLHPASDTTIGREREPLTAAGPGQRMTLPAMADRGAGPRRPGPPERADDPTPVGVGSGVETGSEG